MTDLDPQVLNQAKELLFTQKVLLAEMLHKELLDNFLHRVIMIPEDCAEQDKYKVLSCIPVKYTPTICYLGA